MLSLVGGDAQPVFAARDVEGREYSGRIESWQMPGMLIMRPSGKQTVGIESSDLDRVTLTGAPPAARLAEWSIRLHDGSNWYVEITGGDERQVQARHAQVGELPIHVDALSSISRRTDRPARQPAAGDDDVAVLASGEMVHGSLARLSADGIVLTVGSAERQLAWRDLRAVILAAAPDAPRAGLSALIDLNDGSRCRAKSLRWRDGEFEALTATDARLTINASAVSQIEMSGGRRVWLSELPSVNFECKPYLSKTWPLRVDENVMGGPLVVAGRAYTHGLGLHSACRATWNLDGKYHRFRAAVGIDDSAGSLADADVMVWGDGRIVAEFRHLAAGQPPRPVDVDVRGVKDLTVEVGFGRGGHVQDRVNLVDPALIAATPEK
jgi:hypothetical protein